MAEIIRAEFRGRKNLTGKKFVRLTVLSYLGYKDGKCRNHYYQCRCECGVELAVSYGSLTGGKQVSCGCKRGERHGLTGTPIHGVWANVLTRCLNENNEAYSRYGGRGIKVCRRYRESLAEFAGDVGQESPFDGATLDREDNAGHYSCGKCQECESNGWRFNLRWATKQEQARNTRRNRRITIDGVTKLLVEWLQEKRMRQDVFHKRIRRGWSEADAITIPPDRGRRKS